MSEQELTTINVKRNTLERIKALCLRSVSYDDFLNQCLDLYEKTEVKIDA